MEQPGQDMVNRLLAESLKAQGETMDKHLSNQAQLENRVTKLENMAAEGTSKKKPRKKSRRQRYKARMNSLLPLPAGSARRSIDKM